MVFVDVIIFLMVTMEVIIFVVCFIISCCFFMIYRLFVWNKSFKSLLLNTHSFHCSVSMEDDNQFFFFTAASGDHFTACSFLSLESPQSTSNDPIQTQQPSNSPKRQRIDTTPPTSSSPLPFRESIGCYTYSFVAHTPTAVDSEESGIGNLSSSSFRYRPRNGSWY